MRMERSKKKDTVIHVEGKGEREKNEIWQESIKENSKKGVRNEKKAKREKVFFQSISNKNCTDDSRHMTNTHTTTTTTTGCTCTCTYK